MTAGRWNGKKSQQDILVWLPKKLKVVSSAGMPTLLPSGGQAFSFEELGRINGMLMSEKRQVIKAMTHCDSLESFRYALLRHQSLFSMSYCGIGAFPTSFIAASWSQSFRNIRAVLACLIAAFCGWSYCGILEYLLTSMSVFSPLALRPKTTRMVSPGCKVP